MSTQRAKVRTVFMPDSCGADVVIDIEQMKKKGELPHLGESAVPFVTSQKADFQKGVHQHPLPKKWGGDKRKLSM